MVRSQASLACRLLIARRRVVVKAVLGVGIHVHLVAHAGSLQCCLERRPHGVDALVVLRILDEQRRLDVGHARRLGRRAVERHARLQVGAQGNRQGVHRAAAPAEAGDAERARRQRMRLEKTRAVEHVGAQLGLVEAGLQRAALVVVAGIAADRKQSIRRQRQEALRGGAPRHVLDVGVESAVLVDHQHGGERPLSARLHQVAAHGAGAAAGRGIADVARLDALVGEGDGLRLRVTGQQRLRHGQAGYARDRDRARPGQELAAVDVSVAVLVVEIVDALVDLQLGHRRWRLRVGGGAGKGHGLVVGHRSSSAYLVMLERHPLIAPPAGRPRSARRQHGGNKQSIRGRRNSRSRQFYPASLAGLTSGTAAAPRLRSPPPAVLPPASRRVPCITTLEEPKRSTSPRAMTRAMGVGRR